MWDKFCVWYKIVSSIDSFFKHGCPVFPTLFIEEMAFPFSHCTVLAPSLPSNWPYMHGFIISGLYILFHELGVYFNANTILPWLQYICSIQLCNTGESHQRQGNITCHYFLFLSLRHILRHKATDVITSISYDCISDDLQPNSKLKALRENGDNFPPLFLNIIAKYSVIHPSLWTELSDIYLWITSIHRSLKTALHN